ncbi:MAG: beta-galactosidase [Anaerolineae bacterium]
MEPITFDTNSYRVGGEPFYLCSGEFHYFRVPRPDWQRRLTLFKEAGGNTVATYIPWLLHEPREGTFVFDGDDGATDLEGFLEAALDAGLYVIARPGPYQYSELIYGGLPGWLFERYPEVQARTIDGEPFGLPSASYLHPTFLEKVDRWLETVGPILSQYTVSRDGPVALTQFDNELMGIHIWFGGLDYNPETMGFGEPDGRYPHFVRERYGTIAELNDAYGTGYATFADVEPLAPGHATPGRPEDIRRLRDYFDFYRATTTEYAQHLCATLRETGIDTPFIHNAANPGMNAYFVEMAEAVAETSETGFLLGSDHYYNLSQSWPQNNPTPQYARNVFLSNEQLRLMGYPPTVLELPSGSASDWPPITPRDAKTCYLTNLAYGMKGHNYYVLTGGPNPPGAGETTDLYDYGAPIGPYGEIRPLYHKQAEFASLIEAHPWLVEGSRVFDCRLGLSFEYARSDRYWLGRGDALFSPAEAWRFLGEGLLSTAFCASMSPVGVGLDGDAWLEDVKTPVMVASAESMSLQQQERLVRFLHNGGRLLIAPVLPRLDEDLRPCTRLADFLGAPQLRQGTEAVIRVRIKGEQSEVVNVLKNEVFFTEDLPEDAKVIGNDDLTGRPIAWETRTAGGGQVIFLGLAWDHRKNEQSAALLALMQRLGLNRVVTCSNPNVWTSLITDGGQCLLFLMNLFSAPMKAKIRYRSGHADFDLGEQKLEAMSVKVLEVS